MRLHISANAMGFAAVALLTTDALAKRQLPTEVPPVVSGEVRYEAPHFNNPCGQNGGCVVAYDNATGALMWSVKVYCTHYDPTVEEDVQDVFITALSVENGQILVTNESGLQFAIDTTTRQVRGGRRGCGDESGSGCHFLPARSVSTRNGFVAVAGLCGVAAILRRRGRTRS